MKLPDKIKWGKDSRKVNTAEIVLADTINAVIEWGHLINSSLEMHGLLEEEKREGCCEKCTCKCKGAVTAHYGCDNVLCKCHQPSEGREKERTPADVWKERGGQPTETSWDSDEEKYKKGYSGTLPIETSWEEEFDEIWGRAGGVRPIKAFITQLLEDERAKVREMVPEEIEHDECDCEHGPGQHRGWNACRAEMLRRLEGKGEK